MNGKIDLTTLFNHLDQKMILRYLHYRGQGFSEHIENLLNEAIFQVKEHSECRYLLNKVEVRTFLKSSVYASKDLQLHLKDAEYASLAVCTLGLEVSRKITYLMVSRPELATVMNAVASVAVEGLASQIHKSLGETTMRYSPGYGDLNLLVHHQWLESLDAGKKIGVHCTEGGMLMPEKSIVFIAGHEKNAKEHKKKSCITCLMKNCIYREKRGSSC